MKWIFLYLLVILIVAAIFFAGVFTERIRPNQCLKWIHGMKVEEGLKVRCQYIDNVDSIYLFRCDDQLVMVQDV